MILGGMFIVQLGIFQIGTYARKSRYEVLGCVDLKVGKEHRQNIFRVISANEKTFL